MQQFGQVVTNMLMRMHQEGGTAKT